jgi:DNA-binding response OmpR family regulator
LKALRVLLVDTGAARARALQLGLQQHGYSVDVAATAEAGDEAAVVDHHDLIVLVGETEGFDAARLCRALRGQQVTVPILILAEQASTAAKIAGLDAGADDYLAGRDPMAELLARLRSLLRRSTASEGSILRSGELVMNLAEHRVTLAGVPVKLSAKEYALLEFMMRNPRRLLTRTMISASVWDMNHESSSNVIDVYVSALRRKIDRDPLRPRIETVIGCGYRYLDPDEAADAVDLDRPRS